jgi:glycosyltransferase involved in cell wall biosynthesis
LLNVCVVVAQFPYFVLGPNTLVSLFGLMRGRDTTTPTPARNWRTATVDVIIPARNEEANIVRCLASLQRQSLAPRKIVVVDDGSRDATSTLARQFGDAHDLNLLVITRQHSIGKTPSIKEQTRTLDSDVLFVLDADTILTSDNYIERTVQDLYQGAGIASAWGSILPLREKDRRAADESAAVRAFAAATPSYRPAARKTWLRRVASGITNTYREVLYTFLQRFVFHGQMAAFGTVANPAGCAVAYRRAYLEALFDGAEADLGDDLTNSEDIFIGLGALNEGYRNVQVIDVCARTVEPEIQRLPKQLYLWSSAFLQSAFYFDALLRSPFKALKRWRLRRASRKRPGGPPRRVALPSGSVAYAGAGPGAAPNVLLSVAAGVTNLVSGAWHPAVAGSAPASVDGERRLIREPYRQAFGQEYTRKYGRPAGWMLLTSAIEKVGFPTALLIMAMVGNVEGLLMTIGVETALSVAALMVVMKGRRVEYLVKGIAIAPVRYTLLVFELVTLARFAADMWLTGNRRWRK